MFMLNCGYVFVNSPRGIGVPLKFDNNTLHGEYDHYARILIDLDLSSRLPETLLIERVGKSFFIDVHVPREPQFYFIPILFHDFTNQT